MKKLVTDMTTPELVREFVDRKCAGARGERIDARQHHRLGLVVTELRDRGVLD